MLHNHEQFFEFIKERENIRLCKETGKSYPWSDDNILSSYKFTNVRREHDKTSMRLIHSFYKDNQADDRKTILMNAALFRYFGTYEFAEHIGWQEYDNFDFDFIKDTAKSRLANGMRVFTGAYVITNQGIKKPKYEVVVDYFLRNLHRQANGVVHIANESKSWEKTSKFMMTINGFGGTGFMTKEILLDTMYTKFWKNDKGDKPIDYDEWTPIGPGGLRGAARVLGTNTPRHNSINHKEALKTILELTKMQSNYWPDYWGRLYPTDIQFQLCEFDKYERVRLGQGRPRSRYKVTSRVVN